MVEPASITSLAPEARRMALRMAEAILFASAEPLSAAEIGERLRILPNHACPVSNLFDRVHLVAGDHVVATESVAARGRVD